jgi:hypothetical protein
MRGELIVAVQKEQAMSLGVIATVTVTGIGSIGLNGTGDLNMVFKENNLLAVFAMLQPLVAGIPIVQSLFAAYSALALADTAVSLGNAALRLAKGLAWASGNDPLVQRSRRAAAANDDDAWPVRPFHFVQGDAA